MAATLIPKLSLAWPGGWLLLSIGFVVQALMLLKMPRAVCLRLFDRKGWSKKQIKYFRLGKVFSLICLVFIVLSPMDINSAEFFVGLIFFIIGLILLVIAMINYENTPIDQPVTRGLYRCSRHPQIVGVTLEVLGICIAIGSIYALIALVLSRLLQHFGILAEEVCLQQYGDAYRCYMQQVPRYLFWK